MNDIKLAVSPVSCTVYNGTGALLSELVIGLIYTQLLTFNPMTKASSCCNTSRTLLIHVWSVVAYIQAPTFSAGSTDAILASMLRARMLCLTMSLCQLTQLLLASNVKWLGN